MIKPNYIVSEVVAKLTAPLDSITRRQQSWIKSTWFIMFLFRSIVRGVIWSWRNNRI